MLEDLGCRASLARSLRGTAVYPCIPHTLNPQLKNNHTRNPRSLRGTAWYAHPSFGPEALTPKTSNRLVGFRDSSSGTRDSGSGFRVSGFGIRVQGCGVRISGPWAASNATPRSLRGTPTSGFGGYKAGFGFRVWGLQGPMPSSPVAPVNPKP